MDIYAKSEKTMPEGCYKLERHTETGELYWAIPPYIKYGVHLELDFSQRERIYVTEGGDRIFRGRAFREEDLGN